MRFETEAFFEQRLPHGIHRFPRSAIGNPGFDIEAPIGKARPGMALLHRGVDLSVIALWLGHESTETTQIYLHADMKLKERALAHATESGLTPDRFRPPDPLLAFLESL